MLNVFIGYDPHQTVSYTVLQNSILTRASKPVSIIPLILETLPVSRVGLTPFTYTRFLVPYLCDFEGWSLFLDSDILVLDDISSLFDLADDKYAVMVSKNKLRFEWASVMLFNNDKCRMLKPSYIETAKALHGCEWAGEDLIGELPARWNHLIGYDAPRDDPALVHYTQGIPCFPETEDCEHAEVWRLEAAAAMQTVPWATLMANSVHAEPVLRRLGKLPQEDHEEA